MEHEKSCGGIVFRASNGKIFFLVMKHKETHGGHWDFPKGHVEEVETEEQTAIREIHEEAGLNVNILSGFREEIEYSPKPDVMKTVVFFLAETDSLRVRYIFDEMDNHGWFEFDDAMKRLTHDNSRKILKKANEFLKSKMESEGR